MQQQRDEQNARSEANHIEGPRPCDRRAQQPLPNAPPIFHLREHRTEIMPGAWMARELKVKLNIPGSWTQRITGGSKIPTPSATIFPTPENPEMRPGKSAFLENPFQPHAPRLSMRGSRRMDPTVAERENGGPQPALQRRPEVDEFARHACSYSFIWRKSAPGLNVSAFEASKPCSPSFVERRRPPP